MFDVFSLAFYGAVAYLVHCALFVGRRAWSGLTGRPVRIMFPEISPQARRAFRIAGRVSLAVAVAGLVLLFMALSALGSSGF